MVGLRLAIAALAVDAAGLVVWQKHLLAQPGPGLLRLGQRLQRFRALPVLERHPDRGHMQHGHRQGVCHQVMDFSG